MSKRIPIFLGLILIFLALWLLITPTKTIQLLVERLDDIGYDLQLRTRVLTTPPKLTTPIAIIDIDESSLKAEGHWPWPREKLADLVNKLKNQGAAVIAFDIFFPEKEPNVAEILLTKLAKNNMLNTAVANTLKASIPLFDNDTIFAKSLEEIQSILAIGFLSREVTNNELPPPLLILTTNQREDLQITEALGYISNIAILQKAAKSSGFVNIFPDNDGIIRHAPLIMEYKGAIYPALSVQAVRAFLNQEISLVTPLYHDSPKLEGIKLGELTIPTDGKGYALIPFIGKSYTFPYYSATDVLQGKIPKDSLQGKILFIGTSATGLGDLQASAIENPFPGVEIQATLANGILENNFSYKPEWTYGANIVLTFFLGLIAALLFPHLGPRSLGLIILLFPPFALFVNNWIWMKSGLILSFLMPLILVLSIALLNLLYGYLFETRRREHLKEMFGQYVPEKHIDEMLKSTINYALYGEDREMSVLFADIRHFTTISERLTAKELVEMLNTFFTPMTEIIFNHHGTIDKYIGDLIMAFWGAPLKDNNHARHALASALEMQKKLTVLNPTLASHKWPEIKIGIGINSGSMSVGDMGSRFRRNYTVVGDSVNLASRVEGLTKFYGVNIIVTENTQKNQNEFLFRKLDQVRVKGKKNGIAIYELVCKTEEITPLLKEELDVYEQAIQLYFRQQWDEAEVLMSKLHTLHPKNKLYHIYLERINEFKKIPPPPDWDGIYEHLFK